MICIVEWPFREMVPSCPRLRLQGFLMTFSSSFCFLHDRFLYLKYLRWQDVLQPGEGGLRHKLTSHLFSVAILQPSDQSDSSLQNRASALSFQLFWSCRCPLPMSSAQRCCLGAPLPHAACSPPCPCAAEGSGSTTPALRQLDLQKQV